jgi:precorrin-4 methylase
MKRVRQLAILFTIGAAAAGWLWPPAPAAWGRGHFYVIGTGPAGPQTATLEALDAIKLMDAIIAPDQHVKLFSDYVRDKPILFDPWEGLFDYKGKFYKALKQEEMALFREERFRLRDERVKYIKELLSQGKDVGLLDYGNPCLFGPSHWYVEQFDPQDVVIIPGMGSDAAAMAALGRSTIPAHDVRFVIQTAPIFLMGQELRDSQILKDLARYPATMILYMALWAPERLFAALSEVFPSDTPCAVVYWAGYPDRQRILRGTVADMGQKLSQEKERYMGLLFIGRFLEGKPYEAAQKRLQSEEQ